MLDSLQKPIAVTKAKNTPPSASKASSEEFGLVNEVGNEALSSVVTKT